MGNGKKRKHKIAQYVLLIIIGILLLVSYWPLIIPYAIAVLIVVLARKYKYKDKRATVMEIERHDGKCVSCGLTGFINEQGYCEECVRKMEEKIKSEQREKAEIEKVDRIRYDKEKFENEGATCAVSKDRLIKAFNRFYKFFHLGSIIVSISMAVIWFFYWLNGTIDESINQGTSILSYQNGTVQRVPANSTFNPHGEVVLYAIIILIFGLFLSYISAAICRWVENN